MSAKGSRNFPTTVTAPYLLAKKPSRMSVIKAKPKNSAARKLPNRPGKFKHRSTTGMQASLKIVNVLGKLESFLVGPGVIKALVNSVVVGPVTGYRL